MDPFVKAYHEFKESIDFSQKGILPDPENMLGYLLMGIPHVPADKESGIDASLIAVDQRIAILKAVFTELNHNATEDFLDRGLSIYDRAGEKARLLLKNMDSQPDNE
jgi:hypothetical protein